jgi:hypothetical protein
MACLKTFSSTENRQDNRENARWFVDAPGKSRSKQEVHGYTANNPPRLDPVGIDDLCHAVW